MFLRQLNDDSERGGDRIKSEGRKKFGRVPECNSGDRKYKIESGAVCYVLIEGQLRTDRDTNINCPLMVKCNCA